MYQTCNNKMNTSFLKPLKFSPKCQMEVFGVPWPALNDGVSYTEIARYDSSAQSVLDYYASRYERSAPREGWLRRIERGQIEIDGAVVTLPEVLIRDKASLVYHRLPWEEPFAPYILQILYEDEHLLAINKPPGLQVLPAGLFQQRTVLSQLQWRMKASSEGHPTPVHRLGRGTSGVLLCAKSNEARSALASKLAADTFSGSEGRSKLFSKVYRALVCGILEDDEISIDRPIGKVQYPGVRGGLYMAVAQGKPSYSKVTTLQRNADENTTIVQVEIYSGRPHQIRIHLASIGHPLVGDPLYVKGGQPSPEILNSSEEGTITDDGGHERPLNPVPGDCGYHLHAHRLIFNHPVSKERMEIVAALPLELQTSDSE